MRFKTIIVSLFLILLLSLVIYTRFVGLDWGLPYPMHPDERNMVVSILQLDCKTPVFQECYNPHFFAYGQFPLYLTFILSMLVRPLLGEFEVLRFETVTLVLRSVSAIASLIMVLYLYRILDHLFKLTKLRAVVAVLLLTFVPSFIQFSHYGTTESLLMMFVSILLYYSVRYLDHNIHTAKYVRTTGILLGLAFSTKVSAGLLAAIPFFVLMYRFIEERSWEKIGLYWFALMKIAAFSTLFCVITSPFNIIDWEGFVHSMNYESAVGLGTYRAFYTRQFEYTIPFIFQFIKIFPYTLGWPMFVLSAAGFFLLPWNRHYNLMRFIFLVLFIPNAVMYAKWTRFIAPVFPVSVLFGTAFLYYLLQETVPFSRSLLIAGTFVIILPGIAYLTIYQTPDVRFVASRWMYENIPSTTSILAETANVVDVPLPNPLVEPEKVYSTLLHPISFDFYELDNNQDLPDELAADIRISPYIFVPSRRIFWNHTCFVNEKGIIGLKTYDRLLSGYETDRCENLRKEYPLLNIYYEALFDGELGYEQVAEFTSYPRIEIFGRTLIEFPDEAAEETWTVFDHPVIRVYQRVQTK